MHFLVAFFFLFAGLHVNYICKGFSLNIHYSVTVRPVNHIIFSVFWWICEMQVRWMPGLAGFTDFNVKLL